MCLLACVCVGARARSAAASLSRVRFRRLFVVCSRLQSCPAFKIVVFIDICVRGFSCGGGSSSYLCFFCRFLPPLLLLPLSVLFLPNAYRKHTRARAYAQGSSSPFPCHKHFAFTYFNTVCLFHSRAFRDARACVRV